MHSIELLLDDHTDAHVRDQWATISAAGLPSQSDHSGASNAPHVTLLARPRLDPARDDHARALLADALPLTVELGAPMVFGRGRGHVLVRSVVPTVSLLELQALVVDLAGGTDDVPHVAPGGWTAHVTLAHRLDAEGVGRALAALEAAADTGTSAVAGACAVREDTASQLVAGRRWDSDAREVVPL